jgi:hypothetical protein
MVFVEQPFLAVQLKATTEPGQRLANFKMTIRGG